MNLFFLSRTQLFNGLREDEIVSLLNCLEAHEKSYEAGDVIYRAGTSVREIGLVEEGNVHIVEYDYLGNKSILGTISPGDIFALSYAAIPGKRLQSDVVANEDSVVLFMNIEKLLEVCPNSCPYHNRIVQNLFRISARKMLALHQRMKHMSGRSIRDKVISYLSEQAFEHGSPQFTISFNRQQLADYLGVDRSALSSELSKMQKDGLISYKRNDFALKDLMNESGGGFGL